MNLKNYTFSLRISPLPGCARIPQDVQDPQVDSNLRYILRLWGVWRPRHRGNFKENSGE